MDKNFKGRSFKFALWIMLIFLIGDTIDTIYRTVSGYLGDGSSIPGVDVVFKPTTIDMIVFVIIEIGVIYGIYLLYKLKKNGGYWFLGSNILFLIYASLFGPIAEIGFSTILPMFILYFGIYVILVIGIPNFYSNQFD
mgnify:CR=1 FL=1